MASFASTSVLAPLTTLKIVPYIPPALKPKPKLKIKPTTTAGTTGAVHSEPGSNAGEAWLAINDSQVLGSDESCSFDLGGPAEFGTAETSTSLNLIDGPSIALELEEHAPPSQGWLDEGDRGHSLNLEKTKTTPSQLWDGSRSGETLPTEDVVSITYKTSLTSKRPRSPSEVTIETDIAPESDPEVRPLPKRQRLAERGIENNALEHVHTPDSICLSVSTSPTSLSSAGNGTTPGFTDCQCSIAESSIVSQNDLTSRCDIDEDNAHAWEVNKGLVCSLRQPVALDEVREGHKTYQDDDSWGRERCAAPVYESRYRPPRTALRLESRPKMPLRTSPRVGPSRARRLSQLATDSVTQPRSRQTYPARRKTGDKTKIDHGSGAGMAYQITDLAHYDVPKGASILTAIVRYPKPILSVNATALEHEILGDRGRVIRMTQLSLDSWMLLGYRYDDAVGAYERRTIPESKLASTVLSDTASDCTNYEDDNEEYESDQEDLRRNRAKAGSGRRSDTGTQRSHKLTRVPWQESDEERLLSYRDKMSMDWDQIFSRFPDRSEGAVKLRYYALRQQSRCIAT